MGTVPRQVRSWRSVGLSPFSDTADGAVGAAMLNTSMRLIWNLRCANLCLAKYLSKFAAKFRSKYRRLRTRLCHQLHRQLHRELNIVLYLGLDASLCDALLKQLFKTLFRQLFAKLFGLLFDLKYLQLQSQSYLVLYRQMLPPRRPVGRGVDGRIVVRTRPHYHIWCM